eukprot:m.278624 g.278624  ORF g.278624 m.278624 type:complete len:279 (+) comp54889_c0_seq10:57-893(+)
MDKIEYASSNVLVIRGLSPVLSEAEIDGLLQHFGAVKVEHPRAPPLASAQQQPAAHVLHAPQEAGRFRHPEGTALAYFQTPQFATRALFKLHQLKILGRVISAEYSRHHAGERTLGWRAFFPTASSKSMEHRSTQTDAIEATSSASPACAPTSHPPAIEQPLAQPEEIDSNEEYDGIDSADDDQASKAEPEFASKRPKSLQTSIKLSPRKLLLSTPRRDSIQIKLQQAQQEVPKTTVSARRAPHSLFHVEEDAPRAKPQELLSGNFTRKPVSPPPDDY